MSADKAPSAWDAATTQAGAESAASRDRAGSGIDAAVTRNADRSADSTARGLASVARASSSAGGTMVATFADIERVTLTVANHTIVTTADSATVLQMPGRSDLLESLILSPATGAIAEAALYTSVARLNANVLIATGLGLVFVTIVSTYQLADAALQVAAAGLGAVADGAFTGMANHVDLAVAVGRAGVDVVGTEISGDVTVLVAGAETVVAGATVAGTAILGIGLAVDSLRAGLARATIGVAWESLGATADTVAKNPWMLIAPAISLPFVYGGHVGERFTADRLIAETAGSLQGYIGAMGPSFDGLIDGLIGSSSVFGWEDDGTLHDTSIVADGNDADPNDLTEAQRRGKFVTDSGGVAPAADIVPTNVQELVQSMAQIDYLGDNDEAVIRVLRTDGSPPAFTVIIPSTQNWAPDGTVPNDILGNLNVMGGDSALQRLAAEALDREIAKEMARNPGTPLGDYPVLLAGFSQGGITAAAMAEANTKYNIQQIVTVASPISDFTGIPDRVNVLAFEDPSDFIPTLDGGMNPTASNWETIRQDNGALQAHAALPYSEMAGTEAARPAHTNNLGTFLGPGKAVDPPVDYYGRKAK